MQLLFVNRKVSRVYCDCFIAEVDEAGVLRMLALVTCLLRVFERGLKTFESAKYRQLNKRLARTIG